MFFSSLRRRRAPDASRTGVSCGLMCPNPKCRVATKHMLSRETAWSPTCARQITWAQAKLVEGLDQQSIGGVDCQEPRGLTSGMQVASKERSLCSVIHRVMLDSERQASPRFDGPSVVNRASAVRSGRGRAANVGNGSLAAAKRSLLRDRLGPRPQRLDWVVDAIGRPSFGAISCVGDGSQEQSWRQIRGSITTTIDLPPRSSSARPRAWRCHFHIRDLVRIPPWGAGPCPPPHREARRCGRTLAGFSVVADRPGPEICECGAARAPPSQLASTGGFCRGCINGR